MSKSDDDVEQFVKFSALVATVTAIFAYAKVTGLISWPWAAVLLPVTVPFLLFGCAFAIVGLLHVFRIREVR